MIRFPLVVVTLIVLLAFFCSEKASAQEVFDWDGEPLKDVQLEVVRFRGWIPPGDEPIRGTLILIPGRHGDGRGLAMNADWQRFADETRFALMGCQFAQGEPGLYQTDKTGEVSKAIDEALEKFSELSGKEVLAKGPLLFWGSSAGSNVSERYCAVNPDRVVAFGSSKGTRGPGADLPRGKDDIPMFFAVGSKDKAEWVESAIENIEAGVKKKAPWVLALHPTEGHSVGASLDAIRPFLKAAIELRLPTSATSSKLQKVSTRDGWLGDPETYDIAPASSFKGKRSKAIWLPNEESALAWQTYLRKTN